MKHWRIEDKRARIEKRAEKRKSAFPLSVDALFWTASAFPSPFLDFH